MTKDSAHQDEVLARIDASTFRLWGAIGIIFAFGVLLLWIAATGATGSLAGNLLFLVMSALAFFGAFKLHSVLGLSIELTHTALRDSHGRILCETANIADIDRSFFAFKPSNGFIVRLKTPDQRAWIPGMWWRVGRRIGVGGITSVAQAKTMADVISLLLKGDPDVLEALDQRPFAR